jgi:diguanylate cyclase (GGDEF)-like protein
LDAIDALLPVGEYFESHREQLNDGKYMLVWHENIAKAYLLSGNLEEAGKHLLHVKSECAQMEDHYTMVSVYCIQAMHYHLIGETKKREEYIARVHKITNSNIPIMDLFDDYYDYCKLLLELNKEEEFWHIIDIMESTVKSLDFTNLQLRIISLKIKFYRKNGKNAEYLQGAGLYYELSERSEIETQNMMSNVLNLRKRLQSIQQENAILQKKSETDPLTQLANRASLNEKSEQIFADCLKNGCPLVVEILDIDDFKGFNDNYGHQKGDECLVHLANILKTMEDEHGAFVARYGGDEFILIYRDITWEQAVEYAEELRRKVVEAAMPFPHSKIADVVTITQGLCWSVPIGQNRMWDYLHAADNMLYRTKKKARNHYTVGDLKQTEDIIVTSIPQTS